MIPTTRTIAYAFKNFRNHMGVADHVTLRGMLRRYARKYPKTYNGLKKCSVMASLYYAMMSLMPTSGLPLQKEIKLSLYSFARLLTKAWFYNIFSPEPQQYLIKLNQIILSALDNQLYDIVFIQKYFSEIEQLIKEEKMQLKSNSYLDLLLYSEIILQNIIRYEKRLLLQQSILTHYEWVYQTVMNKLPHTKITNKQMKHVRLVYPLIQYILSYATQQGQHKCIHLYYLMAKEGNAQGDQSFGFRVMEQGLRQSQFTQSLKRAYFASDLGDIREQIMHIFQQLNKIYQREGKVNV